jgi:hypothetical protein
MANYAALIRPALLLLNLALFIPMAWGAPRGPVIVVRNAVAIVPSVAGEVTDVPVAANTALRAGEVLFRIDPTPYEAQVKAIEAQLKLSDMRWRPDRPKRRVRP